MVTQLLHAGISSIRPTATSLFGALSKQRALRSLIVSSSSSPMVTSMTCSFSTKYHPNHPPAFQNFVIFQRTLTDETVRHSKICPYRTFHNQRQRQWLSTAAVSYSDDEHGPSSSSSTIPFLLADIGEGIAEVELLQWFVNEGDHVSQFDKICEVQSDKATVDITSRYDGKVSRLQGKAGDMIKVGTPLLYIEGDHHPQDHHHHHNNYNHDNDIALEEDIETLSSMHEADVLKIPQVASKFHLKSDDDNDDDDDDDGVNDDGYHPQMTDTTTTSTSGARTPSMGGPVLTTPAIRKLAKEYHLDLSTIVGTGPKGRVLKGDVLSLLRTSGKLKKTTPTTPPSSSVTEHIPEDIPSSSPLMKETGTHQQSNTGLPSLPLQQDVTVPLRGYSRLMVQSMTASLQIPHMVYCDEVDMSHVKTLKKSSGISILPFAIKAISSALHRYPQLNATYNGDDLSVTYHAAHNIGIAMDTPRGLVVPVIFNCQDKSIADIAADLERFKNVVVHGSCKFDATDLQNATFTLSNIGAIGSGGTTMSPIVTSPQVAIGAMGKIQRLPRFVNDDSMEVVEAHIMSMSWGGDHRVVDGATMARFHTTWKEYMEQPMKLLANLK